MGVWAMTEYVLFSWHLIAMVGLTISIMWAGYEFQRLCSRLSPDEYFCPMILIWVDVFIVMIGICICLVACSEGDLEGETSVEAFSGGVDAGGASAGEVGVV